MRFCPFCSAENIDEASECAACARRLPPLPPRRRKHTATSGTEILGDAAKAAEGEEEGGLAVKNKTRADLGAGPASARRKPTRPEPTPHGIIERRKATASPNGRGGRRQTAPPVPSRAVRDFRASLSTGVAPGLASESIPLPDLSGRAGSQPYAAASAPAADSTPAPVSAQAQAQDSDPAPVSTPTAVSAAAPDANYEHEWPAPVTSAAAHPDDWSLESEAPESRLSSASDRIATADKAPATSNPVSVPDPVDSTGATQLVTTVAEGTTKAPDTSSLRTGAKSWPPPTRTTPIDAPFKSPEVMPIPEVPEAGLWKALKYTINFERAKWQRRGAIKSLRTEMRQDTGMLDGILGALGKEARALGIDSKPLQPENRAIEEAEMRRKTADHECSELSNRQAEEKSKLADGEQERQSKVTDADRSLDRTQSELGGLEAQRKELREQSKKLETLKKNYLREAENRDADSNKDENSETRQELRQAAQSLRAKAAGQDKERQDIERRIVALEGPITQISARVGALKSDVDAAKRALTDLREGHRHRLAEIEAELGHRSRELAQSEAEIQRREVTLGTLVNLNRIERNEFTDLYERIDALRGGIGARSNQIDKFSAEREAYDKASRIRGAVVLAGTLVLFVALLAVVLSVS